MRTMPYLPPCQQLITTDRKTLISGMRKNRCLRNTVLSTHPPESFYNLQSLYSLGPHMPSRAMSASLRLEGKKSLCFSLLSLKTTKTRLPKHQTCRELRDAVQDELTKAEARLFVTSAFPPISHCKATSQHLVQP